MTTYNHQPLYFVLSLDPEYPVHSLAVHSISSHLFEAKSHLKIVAVEERLAATALNHDKITDLTPEGQQRPLVDKGDDDDGSVKEDDEGDAVEGVEDEDEEQKIAQTSGPTPAESPKTPKLWLSSMDELHSDDVGPGIYLVHPIAIKDCSIERVGLWRKTVSEAGFIYAATSTYVHLRDMWIRYDEPLDLTRALGRPLSTPCSIFESLIGDVSDHDLSECHSDRAISEYAGDSDYTPLQEDDFSDCDSDGSDSDYSDDDQSEDFSDSDDSSESDSDDGDDLMSFPWITRSTQSGSEDDCLSVPTDSSSSSDCSSSSDEETDSEDEDPNVHDGPRPIAAQKQKSGL